MINSSRSERGWQGRRRIAVLVSIVGVLGIAALGSTSSASAASVAGCKAKLEPKGGAGSTNAKLSFTCDGPVRAYSVGSNKAIKGYSAPNAGSASSFFTCEGVGVGFGCGVSDRAAPGNQTPGTTGWEATPPPPSAGGSNQTDVPKTCNGFRRVQGAGTGVNGPNLTAIVTPACTQLIPAGTKVTQSLKLKSSPCSGTTQLYLMVGGEPAVTSFIAAVSGNVDPTKNGPGGDSATVGEYLQAPMPVNMSAYKNCQGSGGKGGGAKKSAVPATKYPVSCSGNITPDAAVPGDSTLSFTCSQNVRAFALYSNVSIDLPGDEPIVTGNNGGKSNEGALHQCEGLFPGPGYGCGVVNRQEQSGPSGNSPGLPNGDTITAGNSVSQTMGFDSRPCKRKGEAKPKAWLVVMGEPTTSATTVGEFSSAPQPMQITGFGKCKGGKKK